jgi:hypothetical protein
MEHVTTGRRLVKSPPELWAELSDPEALARRLGELGEIRITRALPETAVAWEAERASGVVEIESSGWGTRVSLSAAPTPPPPPDPPPPAPPPARVETELRRVAEEAVRVEIPPDPPPPVPREPAARASFLSRLFGRAEAAPTPPKPPPPPPAPPEVLELRLVHVACACRVPERPAPDPPPATAAGLEREALRSVLERVLDDLGAAHHRPFSRS